MNARANLYELLEDSYLPGPLPSELVTTDRIMQRWAVSIGLGLPTEEWDDMPRARPPQLDDGTAMVVDRIVMKKLHDRARDLILEWYKRPTPAPAMARRRRVSLKSLYKQHRCALIFLRWQFESSGYPDLVKLLEVNHE